MEKPIILVLDDELMIGMDLEFALCEAGFNVALATSCAEAERVLNDLRPDVAVLDVQLKDGDCVVVAKTLVDRLIPFVVHTGLHRQDRDKIFEMGAIVYKPSSPDAIVAVVKALLASIQQKGASGNPAE